MALSKENIRQLIVLQQQDAALDKVKKEMDNIPVEISAITGALEANKTAAAEAKARTLGFEKKKKEKELELAQKEETARKHGTDLNQVKTNEAFKALQNEIERAKQEGSQVETEILELMESLDVCKRDEKKLAGEFKAAEERAKAEISTHEARLKDLQGQYDAAKGGRDAVAAPVPAEAMRVYNHIRTRGKPDAVVLIEGDQCSACRISLAPQVIVEATKAKNLVTCESCQRILYMPEKSAAETAQASSPI